MSRAERIRKSLTDALLPSRLEVTDDSAHHAGHAGASPEGETHFGVFVVSDKFEGESRVARQRMINDALKAEFETGLHALAIKAVTPDEAAKLPTS